jgi:hypothetical protein
VKVFVECYHDWALARAMGFSRPQLGHALTKANVLRQLAEFDGEAAGIIDEDAGKLHSNYARQMANYKECNNGYGLRLMSRSGDSRKSLVLIDPRLEEWLCARASARNFHFSKYGLSSSASALRNITRPDQNARFNQFLTDLAAEDNGMKMLGKWLGR